MTDTRSFVTFLDDFREFLTAACAHYERSAPTVEAWLDDAYIRLNETPLSVSVFEIHQILALRENDIWEHPNYAANRCYKVAPLIGRDRGVLSF